jgi:hypothetical protein
MGDRISKIESRLDLLLKMIERFEDTICTKDDPYGILLVLFFERFSEHAQSVRRLTDSRDHILIARSIIEGGVILKWVIQPKDFEERKKRSKKYFDINYITLIERLEAQGKKDDPQYKEIIETVKNLVMGSEGLLSGKDRDNLQKGLPLSFKQFIVRLTDKTLGQIIKDDESLDNGIYERNYNNMCGFHHWNVFYMLHTVTEEGYVRYGKTNEHDYEQSLMTAFFVLAEVSQHLSMNFNLKKEFEISQLASNLVQEMKR